MTNLNMTIIATKSINSRTKYRIRDAVVSLAGGVYGYVVLTEVSTKSADGTIHLGTTCKPQYVPYVDSNAEAIAKKLYADEVTREVRLSNSASILYAED